MYTEIFAKSSINKTSGKTARVWSDRDNIEFSIDEDEALLIVKAACFQQRGYSPEYDVDRTFTLQLEKSEVEKLVNTALNHKLLKKLDIYNLDKIDKLGELERQLEQAKSELRSCRKEKKLLENVIKNAMSVLKKST